MHLSGIVWLCTSKLAKVSASNLPWKCYLSFKCDSLEKGLTSLTTQLSRINWVENRFLLRIEAG